MVPLSSVLLLFMTRTSKQHAAMRAASFTVVTPLETVQQFIVLLCKLD